MSEQKSTPARPRFLLGILVFWTIQGLVSAHPYYEMGVPLSHSLLMSMTSALLWVPLTFWALFTSDRYPISRDRLDRSLLHLGSVVLICVFRALAVVVLNPWVRWEKQLPPLDKLFVTSFHKNFLFCAVLVGAAHAFHYARRESERERREVRLEAQLATAQLRALKAQLHPHFLFNSLQSVAELLHRDVEAADAVLVTMSRLLRQALESESTQEVALAEEIRSLAPYLELEKLRFGERLSVTMDLSPDTLQARVPHLVLQPLVENCIRHGIAPRSAPGHIQIRAQIRAGRLELEVSDDGLGLRAPIAGGVGLSNTRARLTQLYGADHHFELTPNPGRGCVARLAIPLIIAGAA